MLNTDTIYVCLNTDSSRPALMKLQSWMSVQVHSTVSTNPHGNMFTIKKEIQQRCKDGTLFVVLVDDTLTESSDINRIEIEEAISAKLPIVVINLNGIWQQDITTCPVLLRYELAIHISFDPRIFQYAIQHWPSMHETLKKQGETGAYYYDRAVYEKLGIFD